MEGDTATLSFAVSPRVALEVHGFSLGINPEAAVWSLLSWSLVPLPAVTLRLLGTQFCHPKQSLLT